MPTDEKSDLLAQRIDLAQLLGRRRARLASAWRNPLGRPATWSPSCETTCEIAAPGTASNPGGSAPPPSAEVSGVPGGAPGARHFVARQPSRTICRNQAPGDRLRSSTAGPPLPKTSGEPFRLPSVDTDEFGHVENLPVHRPAQLIDRASSRQVELLRERVEPEVIVVVAMSRRRAGPAVPCPLESLGPSRAPAGASAPRPRLLLVGSSPHSTQCTNVPPGASTSSQVTASSTALSGTPLQWSSGD